MGNLTNEPKRRSSQESGGGGGGGSGERGRQGCTTTEWLETFECDGSSICGYVKKVYKMMIESNNNPDIVTWDDQGEVIIIKDKQRFEELILPKFFDSNRYQSFKRQLYNYGFNKKVSTYSPRIYTHQYIYIYVRCTYALYSAY